MARILKIAKFNLFMVFASQSFIFTGVLLLNVLISLVLTNLVERNEGVEISSAGSLDPIGLIWIFILGVLMFPASFRFMLSHGVSRKKFFLGSGLSIAAAAAIWALIVTLVTVISRQLTSILSIYEMLFRNLDFVGMAVWEFSALFLFAVLGWFIYLVYYVSGRKTKLLVTAAPFVIGPLLVLLNIATEGRVFNPIQAFVRFMVSPGILNPYFWALGLLAAGAIIWGVSYLLVRRAQIKD